MSWLYDHRDQLNGYRRYAEIARSFRRKVIPADEDDIEQEITIKLKALVDKKGLLSNAYLYGVARNIVRTYWRTKYKERERLCYLYEGEEGVLFAKKRMLVPPAPDMDARLAARAILDFIPDRMVDLGRRLLEGESLDGADRKYLCKQRHNLSPYIYADTEKVRWMNRLLREEGLNCSEVAKLVGIRRSIVKKHLQGLGETRPRGAVLQAMH